MTDYLLVKGRLLRWRAARRHGIIETHPWNRMASKFEPRFYPYCGGIIILN